MNEDDPPPEFDTSTAPGLVAYLAAVQGGRSVHGAASRAFDRATAGLRPMKSPAGTPLADLAEFTSKEVADITAFAASKGVTANILSGGAGPVGKSFHAPGKSILEKLLDRFDPSGAVARPESVGLRSNSVPLALHEIGHATPILGSTGLRDTWQAIARSLGSGLPGKAARLALVANSLTDPEDDRNRAQGFARSNAPALIAATYLPELMEEGRATAIAIAGARRAGTGVKAVAAQLMPAFGMYAAHAGAPVLATIIAQKLMASLRSKAEPEKTAAAAKEVQSPGLLRTSASSAWRMGVSAPKPKSIKPNTSSTARAKETTKARPPSKTAYFSDVIKGLNNPQRGYRGAKPPK